MNGFKTWTLEQAAVETIKAMLLTDTHVTDIDTQIYISDVSANEITGTGYTAGGVTMTGVVVTQDNASNVAKLDANDFTLANSTITARYIAFYFDSGTPTTSRIISIEDFGSNKISSNGDFTYQVNIDGLLGQA